MTTSINYHTQGIRGYHNKKTQFKGQSVYYHLVATASRCACPYCKSMDTSILPTKEQRVIRGVPVGLKKRCSWFRSGALAVKDVALAPVSALTSVQSQMSATQSGW